MTPEIAKAVNASGVVFAYTAFCVWTAYRYRQKRKHPVIALGGTAPLLVAYASQTGYAEQLAWQTAESLQSVGVGVQVEPLGQLTVDSLAKFSKVLFVVSTTGEGDAPDSAAAFTRKVMGQQAKLSTLYYGVLALGDRSYPQYCAFGHALDLWLRHQGAASLFDVVEVDNGDEGALRHWQHNLSLLTGKAEMPDWTPPVYGRWRLADRRLLNPGSPGGPAFALALEAFESHAAHWQAGDIAEIGPRSAKGGELLPHREYSIASLPADGKLELVVRQMRYPDGRLGVGSGWLTEYAELGGEIALRIRENRGFHSPPDDRPLILIGNGTGIAGLRAHLKSRAALGYSRNWLLFGERTSAADFFFRDEIDSWKAAGLLQRVDLAFSRDQETRVYVQHCLKEAAETLHQWVTNGAAIYVCGSLEGMAGGVAEVLTAALGAELLEEMAADGRYRRDVY